MKGRLLRIAKLGEPALKYPINLWLPMKVYDAENDKKQSKLEFQFLLY